VRAFVSPKTDAFDTHWACWSWWTPRGSQRAAREIRDRALALGLYATPRQTGVIACAPDRTRRLTKLFARFDDMAGDGDFGSTRRGRDVPLENRRLSRAVLAARPRGAAGRCGLRLPAHGRYRRVAGNGIRKRARRRIIAQRRRARDKRTRLLRSTPPAACGSGPGCKPQARQGRSTLDTLSSRDRAATCANRRSRSRSQNSPQRRSEISATSSRPRAL
jgi:hypothetical protein